MGEMLLGWRTVWLLGEDVCCRFGLVCQEGGVLCKTESGAALSCKFPVPLCSVWPGEDQCVVLRADCVLDFPKSGLLRGGAGYYFEWCCREGDVSGRTGSGVVLRSIFSYPSCSPL